jgi:hypothetical protein
VRFSRLIVRNFGRSPLRTGMTVMTVAIMLAAFIFPRALVEAQEARVRQSPNDRVNTRPKQGWNATLPLGYAEQIREMAGVRYVAASRVAALRLPGKDKVFFASRATEMAPYLAMVDELETPAEQQQAFLADERSALVTRALATEQGWKLGDRVVFDSRALPGQWEVTIAAIGRSLREGFAERQIWLHYGFPPIVIHGRVAWLAVALGMGLSMLAPVVPVYRVAQLRVTDALRRLGGTTTLATAGGIALVVFVLGASRMRRSASDRPCPARAAPIRPS